MKKQLLQESEIRKMMKFANIGGLSNGFVDRLNEQEEVMPDEEEAEMAAPEEGGVEDVAPEDLGVEAGPEEGGESEVLEAVGDAVEALKRALSAAGPDGQAAADAITLDEGGEEGVEDVDAMADLGGEEEPMDLAADEMGEDPEAMALAEVEMVDEDAVEEEMVNEVARRVSRRLRLLKERANFL